MPNYDHSNTSSYLSNISPVTTDSTRLAGSTAHGVGGTYADDDSAVSSDVTDDEVAVVPVRTGARIGGSGQALTMISAQHPQQAPPPQEAVQFINNHGGMVGMSGNNSETVSMMQSGQIPGNSVNYSYNNVNNNGGTNDIQVMEQPRAGVMPRNRREWCIVLFAVFIVVAVATGVGLGLGLYMASRPSADNSTTERGSPSFEEGVDSGDGGGGGGTGTTSPTISPGSISPTSSSAPTSVAFLGNYTGDSFSDAIEYHLIAQEISSIASFREVAGADGDTAQQRARDFLVLLDFLPTSVNDEDEDDIVGGEDEEGGNGKMRQLRNSGRAYLKTSTPAYRVVQRFVIATLYFATNGTQWINSDFWLEPGVHECEWLGIQCQEISIPSVSLSEVLKNPDKIPTDENGDVPMTTELMVIEINLPENNLGGFLPQEIMALPYLQMLGLWSNDISGTLPTQMGKLVNLKSVHLEDNLFSGGIPTEIGMWTKIEDLSFSGNGDLEGGIPTEIGYLSNLERLWISDTQLIGPIPTEIGNLVLLGELNLSNNNLNSTLPEEIENILPLEWLDLTSNSLTGEIPESWGSLASLKNFEVGDNELEGELPDFFERFPYLESASFHENIFIGDIPSSIGSAGASLRKLTLGENRFEGELPETLKDCINLERLDLGTNQLKGEIPSWIGDMEKLVFLDLSDNRFSGSVPPELSNLRNLRELRLAENLLVGTVPCGSLETATFLSADCENSVVECTCCTECM